MKFESFTHIQATPAASWTINHDLDQKVAGDVMIEMNGVVSKVLPLSVVHINDNQLEINFSTSYAGRARLVGVVPLMLTNPSWIPDDISPGVTPLTLYTEGNQPLQIDPGGQYLELDD